MVLSKQNPSIVSDTSTSDRTKGWEELINICYDEGKVAKCNNIASSNGVKNTPAPLTMKQFDFNVERDALIETMIINYSDRLVNYNDDSYDFCPQFQAPKITIRSGDYVKVIDGEAPNVNFTKHTIVIDDPKINAEQLNSNEFTVILEYPANTSPNVGSLYVLNFEVEVWYGRPRYNVSFTEPRHEEAGSLVNWSTIDDPSQFPLYSEQTIDTYFRTFNGIVSQQKIIYTIPKCYRVNFVECWGGDINWLDETHLEWTVTPSTEKSPVTGKYKASRLRFYLFTIATTKTDMITAEHYQTQATYYAEIYDQLDFKKRNDDIYISNKGFERLNEDSLFYELFNIDSIPQDALEEMEYKLRVQTRVWNCDEEKYVPQKIRYTMAQNSDKNYRIISQTNEGGTNVTVVDVSHIRGASDNYFGFLLGGYFTDGYGTRFSQVEGNYEFHISVFYEGEGSTPRLFKFPFYVAPAPVYSFEIEPARLQVNTPNIATQSAGGGCTFLCETQNGFGRWISNMSGFSSFIENRYKHIGALRVQSSHTKPKHSTKNPAKEGEWKERKYIGKTGRWDEDTSLHIYLPYTNWKTLQGFVKMDKPVSIEMCPRCSDDDLLNHRGWVVLESISNVERVNPWVYKGDIGVKYLTRKYWAKANIKKANRVCNAPVPYNLIKILGKQDYFLNWFELHGAGQLVYDLDKNIVNEVLCGTGESLHFRNRWVLKDIDDYRFYWTSTLPSEATDMSNDYKYNSITYSVLNAKNKKVLLQYTLYDFTTFDEKQNIVNTCNANCTIFKQGESFNLFNKRIKLEFAEDNPTTYGSCTRFEFNGNYLTLSESGANGNELYETSIQLDSAEYLLDVSFDNNDVGLLEPNFTSTLNIEAYENNLANSYTNFYEDMLISPFPLTGKSLLFYRKSEEGIIYYYTGDGEGDYIINGFDQYKCGVDLQTQDGVSIMYVDNYTGRLYLNNNLVRVGFDRFFGAVLFSVYDYKTDSFIQTNGVKVDKYDVFEIISLTDDKAQVKFGNTIWTMWRGHPYVQCEHIDTDLKIIDEYNTVSCESLMGANGKILYDGKQGKAEVSLDKQETTTLLELEGYGSPSFICGNTITAKAKVLDKGYNSIGIEDGQSIGKIEFIVDGESVYVDPQPSLNENGEYEWVYRFTPSIEGDFEMKARFMPMLPYFESESMPFYYSVNKLPADINATIEDNEIPIGESVTTHIEVIDGDGGDSIEDMRIRVLKMDTGRWVGQFNSEADGVDFNIPTTFLNEGLNYFYAFGDKSESYRDCETPLDVIVVYDPNKTPVTNEIEYTKTNETLTITNGLPSPIEVTVDGETTTVLSNDDYVISPKEAGELTVTTAFNGNDIYRPLYDVRSFEFEPIDINLILQLPSDLPAIVKVGGTFSMNGGIDGTESPLKLTLYDNGSPVTVFTGEDTFSVIYLGNDVGNHDLQVKFAGKSLLQPAESNIESVTIGQNNSYLRRCNGDVYQYTKDMFQLLDGNDNPLVNKEVRYTIHGVTYTRITNNEGTGVTTVNLKAGVYPVLLEFDGDDLHTSCRFEYNLTVIEPREVWKTPRNITNISNNVPPYRKWIGDSFDELTGSEYITCGEGLTNHEVITGKNGTYPQPSELRLQNFGFQIPHDAKITRIRVRWYERQFNPRNDTQFPSIGQGSVVLENLNKDLGRIMADTIPLQSKVGFNSVTVQYITAGEWTSDGILANNLNNANFGVLFKHEKNTSDNVGTLMLKYFTVAVSYVTEAERDII